VPLCLSVADRVQKNAILKANSSSPFIFHLFLLVLMNFRNPFIKAQYMQPVILLTFSNDQDAYLENIVVEQKNIKKHLWAYDNNSSKILVRDVAHSSIEDIFYLVNRYHNRIQFFHFGGHADGNGLQLEKAVGYSQHAYAKGIAGLLGSQKTLKLVFLNGCATEGQVESLLEAGVKAVIATSVPINDNKATSFAEQFYGALVAGASIKEAFIRGKSYLETNFKDLKIADLSQTKGLKLKRASKTKLPWGIYLKPENQSVLDEGLPQENYHEVMINDQVYQGGSIPPLNTKLVKQVFIAIKDTPHAVKLIKEAKANKQKIKPQDLRNAIVRSYLAPISVHLRTLFSTDLSRGYTQDRLQQISTIHLRTMELMAFIMVSDLWDAINRHDEAMSYTESEAAQLNAFFDLNEKTYPYFDFLLLIDAIISIFNRKDWKFYMDELNNYANGFAGTPSISKAHEFLLFIKNVLESDVPSRLIENYCIQAEEQLANLLCDLKYLVKYKLVVVKNIEVIKVRNEPPPKYKHILVELDNNYNDQGTKDTNTQLESFTDMESVLLYKDNITQALSLSPFVIDENALTKNLNSKVFFLQYPIYNTAEVDDDFDDLDALLSDAPMANDLPSLHYQFLENEEDHLVVTPQNHKVISRIFKNVKATILGEPNSESSESDNDDDLNFL
jgi:hypothetical protein